MSVTSILGIDLGKCTYMGFDHALWRVAEVKRLGSVIFEVEIRRFAQEILMLSAI